MLLLLCLSSTSIYYLVLRVSTRAAVDRSACKRVTDWTPLDKSEAMPRHDEHVAQADANITACQEYSSNPPPPPENRTYSSRCTVQPLQLALRTYLATRRITTGWCLIAMYLQQAVLSTERSLDYCCMFV